MRRGRKKGNEGSGETGRPERPGAPLAKELSTLRASHGATLREVQSATGISNAYLSQLEKGRAAEPNPVFLQKLADFYGVDYLHLMELAGYPTGRKPRRAGVGGRIDTAVMQLTDREKEEVLKYIEMILLPRRIK